jgi:hypothetical protein
MLRRVALVRTDVSEELTASFIRVTIIGGLGTTLAVTSNRRTLRRNTRYFFAACVGTRRSGEMKISTCGPFCHFHRPHYLKLLGPLVSTRCTTSNQSHPPPPRMVFSLPEFTYRFFPDLWHEWPGEGGEGVEDEEGGMGGGNDKRRYMTKWGVF